MSHPVGRAGLVALLAITLGISPVAAQKRVNKPVDATPNSAEPWDQPQPDRENLDYVMYQRIRDEGTKRSHVMEYASGLTDGIGARLTGSPNMRRANEWTRDQLAAMGCANAHLEDWGEFGMGWQQLNTWVRMTVPDFQVIIAQAAPWSPSTNGAVQAQAVSVSIQNEQDFGKYKDQLGGKVVLLEKMREVKPVDKALFRRLDGGDLEKITDYPVHKGPDVSEQIKGFVDELQLRNKIGEFLAQEHVVAVIMPSRDGSSGGGSGGTIFDDIESDMGWSAYKREHANALPIAVMAVENYGRIHRLLKANVPVQLEMNLQTRFAGDHEHGFNTIAEIPGTDPNLKDQVVHGWRASRFLGISYRRHRTMELAPL